MALGIREAETTLNIWLHLIIWVFDNVSRRFWIFIFKKTTNRSDFYEAIRRTEARIIGLIKFNLKECASRCFQFKTSVSLCKCMPNSLCMFFFDISIVELRLYQLHFAQFPLSRPKYNNVGIMLISIHMDVNRYRFTFEMFLIWFWSIFFCFSIVRFWSNFIV